MNRIQPSTRFTFRLFSTGLTVTAIATSVIASYTQGLDRADTSRQCV
jgi:hypothetical protein